MSDTEPIVLPLAPAAGRAPAPAAKNTSAAPSAISFSRRELGQILTIYGQKVAAGEWRDYAIDIRREKAVFSVFRRASECPLYRIEKNLKAARKQGAYSVIAPTGLILKRGHDLARVLRVLQPPLRLVDA